MSRTCQSRGRFLEKGVKVENKRNELPPFGYLTNTTRSHRPPLSTSEQRGSRILNKNNISHCLLSSFRSTVSFPDPYMRAWE